MVRKKANQPISRNISEKSSQKCQPASLWQSLTEAEEETTKGGFGFPKFIPRAGLNYSGWF